MTTTTSTASTSGASASERRMLGVVLFLSVLLIGTNSAMTIVVGRVNTALKHGDWAAAGRLQIFWKHAAPSAVRAALLQTIWSHDCARAHFILTHFPYIQLDTFVRQQIGDYDAEVMSAADWSNHRPISPSLEDPKMLETLLENGVNANFVHPSGGGDPTRSALGILLSRRSRIIDPLLIQKSREMERILRKHGARLSLSDAARFGDVAELTHQLDLGVDPNTADWVGRPLIYLAAQNNQIDAVRLLVRRGADLDICNGGAKGISHDTPLMVAERKGHIRLAELLIHCGASTHRVSNSSSDFAALPLIPASAFGNVDHMRFLLAHGARRDAHSPGGVTALMLACLESDVSVPSLFPQSLQSPGDLAARAKRQSAVLDLLIHIGCSVNDRDIAGRTALMQAVWSERLAQQLIANGADENIPDNYGYTPLMETVRLRNQDVLRLLVKSGANVNAENFDGLTALGIALNGYGADVRKDAQACKLVNELRNSGAHISVREAAVSGDAGEFRWRLAHGASIDVLARGSTPLLLAAVRGGNTEIVELLLNRAARVNDVSRRGWTALMVAASDGREDMVRFMLNHGARRDLRSSDGETAQQIARRRNHMELQPLLETLP